MKLKERLLKMLLPEGAIVLTKEEIAALKKLSENRKNHKRNAEVKP